MNGRGLKFSGFLVAAVFIGSILGASFIYLNLQSQVDSLEGELEQAENTRIVYVNGSEGDLSPLFEKVDQSVVYIRAGESRSSQGSGFVYDKNGHIVTNQHLVEETNSSVKVSFTDGTTMKAEIVGKDPHTDLAVLKVQKDNLKPLQLGNSTKAKTGQRAIAIGNPFGLRGSMTVGYISHKGRSLPVQGAGLEGFRIRDIIQTDASINPGNSGGPLLNVQGKVIGVNTAIETNTGTFSGIGFAVPSNTVKQFVPEIIKDKEVGHPWIGVRGLSMTSKLSETMNKTTSNGFLIMNVSEGGPAEKAGLRGGNRTKIIDGGKYILGGDIITEINGEKMRDLDDILNFLSRKAKVGEEVEVTVLRNGEEVEIPLTLQDRPEN